MKNVILVSFWEASSQSDSSRIGMKKYAYFAEYDEVKENDYVVVNARGVFKVAKVMQIKGLTRDQRAKATKWIVQKIDATEYQRKMEAEQIAQEIRNQLQARREEMEEMLIYERLAKDDEVIAGLLQQLGKIENDNSFVAKIGKRAKLAWGETNDSKE